MGKRYRLKTKKAKEIIQKAALSLGNIDLKSFINGIEAAKFTPQDQIFFLGKKPIFIGINGEIVPSLMNVEVIKKLPEIRVDMGAVPNLCNGADLMAPGIVKITGDFQIGALIVVVDEKHSKAIALVKTLYSSKNLVEKKTGKAAKNIHYVGDRFWKYTNEKN